MFCPTTTWSSVRSNSSRAGPAPAPNRSPGRHWRRLASWLYRRAAVTISARETSTEVALDLDGAATRLKSAAEAVADVGLTIAVEAFAWSAINSVPTACDLLARVDAPNAGHLLDVWHFFNSGLTAEYLADLDVATVAAVQLNDGPRVHDNFLWNARNTRLLPGEGELDVRGFVSALRSIGFDGPFGIESSYPEFRQLDVGEAAARAFDATMKYF